MFDPSSIIVGLEVGTSKVCAVVGEVMDEAFPVVDAGQHVESVQKLLSKATPAVLVRRAGTIEGIVTRSDMLAYLMSR